MKLENRLKKWYTIIWNDVILNNNIGLDTKWLYAYLLSRPDDWNFTFWWIQSQLNIWKKKLARMIKELEEEKIIVRYLINKGWEFSRIWIIHPTQEEIDNKDKKEKQTTKTKINKIELNKDVNIENKDEIEKEVENFLIYWNKIFSSNFRITDILLKEYIKKRKEYWKEDIQNWFKQYIKNKQERDKEEWRTKFLLTPLKFLKQSNGLVSYI